METKDGHAITPITREVEQRAYRFLRRRTAGDALRYELIAKKIQRLADGVANPGDAAIALNWVEAMFEDEAHAVACEVTSFTGPVTLTPTFAGVRSGAVGNPIYQSYLDTLEQEQLDRITSNAGFICWHARRSQEARAAGRKLLEYARTWADKNLSTRVQALRAAAAEAVAAAA